MKILIIVYSYYPRISPRAFRWTTISEYWATKGNHIDVICSRNSGLMRSEIINGVHIHRVGNTIFKMLRKKFENDDLIKNKILKKQKKSKNNLRLFLKWIYKHTWEKVYWPDYYCLWFFPAAKKAKELMAIYKYDVLISVSYPFTDHIIGLRIKKYYSETVWIVDIGDPFCFLDTTLFAPLNNQKLYKKLNYIFERKIFNFADRISVTTENTLKKYIELFPESAEKIYVIPPLISLPNKVKNRGCIFLNKDKIKFVFIGTLIKKIRTPEFLLRLFSKLLHTHLSDKLELHFFGRINNCFDFFKPYKDLFNKKIFLHGLVNHDIALQAMNEADFLVNIGNNTPYLLPSKIVDYANTGKPILNLVKTNSDITINFFKKYSASLCLVEKKHIISSGYISKLIHFIENPPTIEPSILKKFIANYQIEKIAGSYEKLFK